MNLSKSWNGYVSDVGDVNIDIKDVVDPVLSASYCV